jgi:hypothetical protein
MGVEEVDVGGNEVDSWNDKIFRMLKKKKQILYQDKSDDHNSNLVDNTYSRSTMACRCSASTETTVFNFFFAFSHDLFFFYSRALPIVCSTLPHPWCLIYCRWIHTSLALSDQPLFFV